MNIAMVVEEDLISELKRIFQVISILSPVHFSFGGKMIVQSREPVAETFTAPQNPLTARLQQELYQHCFCRRFRGTIEEPVFLMKQGEEFVLSLAEANLSEERWETDWRIDKILPSGQIVASRYGLNRLLWPGEYFNLNGPGSAPREGLAISVLCPKQSTTVQPGFYIAYGQTVADQQDETNMVRFYWNIRASDAPELLRSVVGQLNRFQVPFRLKCPIYDALYYRLDSLVLYIGKRFYKIVAELVLEIYDRIRERLGTDTPLFTKPLAPGLGLAENPSTGESFGMNRCRLVAEGIWNASSEGVHTGEARLRHVLMQFDKYGLKFKYPYLNPGSSDSYDWPPF